MKQYKEEFVWNDFINKLKNNKEKINIKDNNKMIIDSSDDENNKIYIHKNNSLYINNNMIIDD